MSRDPAPPRAGGRTTARAGEGTVFLSAGEASGDLHAARLARALRERRPGLRLVGLGGSRMRRAGVELLADLDTLAVMGFAEVLASLPRLLALRRRVRRFLEREAVDLLLPVDYPGFNVPLACRASRLGIPVLYYIAPQVWAWRPDRARRLARCADRVCAVLPFEERFLARYGVDARFVGHPLLDVAGAAGATGAGGAAGAGGTRRGRPLLGLFPGSRRHEVSRMLPVYLEAAELLRTARPDLEVAVARAPDLALSAYPADVRPRLAPMEEVVGRATAALTKSGTVTLQLALAGVPMVVGHRVHPLSYLLARRMVRLDRIALVNLVAEGDPVPELLQGRMTPPRLAAALDPLLDTGSVERDRMRRSLKAVRGRLGAPGCAARVAGEAIRLLERGGEASG